MLIFILRRLIWALMLIFVVTLIAFLMFFVLPGDSRNAQRNEQGFTPSLQTQFNARGSFGAEYGHFLGHIVRGDLGESMRSRDAVTDVIRRTLPVTASLIIGGVLLFLLIAVPIGLLSALRPRSLLDKGLMMFVLIGFSAHPLWLGLMLSYLLGVKAHAFPVGGYCDLTYHSTSSNLCGGPRYWAYHLVLPWITFAFLFAAIYARMIRASLLEAFGEDYVRTARAKGAGNFRIMRTHVFRNAILPVITMLGMDVGVAFAGALFIETVFSLPGMGQLLVRSLANGDLPMILGIVLVVSVAVVIANLLVDIAYSIVDPRIRLRGEGDSITASRSLTRRRVPAQPRVRESATTP
ncbi:MAG: peptide/nickel transport system permease protein [Gaiellaceae bacterium]|nr:peptide/nickel transport system permease protein [Gaiellaceae bacterium]